ncbi:flagellar hook-length control protein FliK [Propionivibrio sp.]|uniref:flagellar hook-length control protein FliK n=1 Tax=Propionivibrio sp. TaxID=2212460 RepID=UPI003BEF9ACB
MSVTIVSTLPKPPQASVADKAASSASGSDNASAGLDFASLLLGQLAPAVAETLLAAPVQKDLPATDAAPADAASLLAAPVQKDLPATDAVPADAAPADAASLIAALGLVALEPGRNSDKSLPDTGKVVKTASDSLTAVQTTVSVGQSLKLEGKADSLKTELASTPTLAGTLAADDKPAKFAVTPFVAASAEAVIVKNVSADSLPNIIPAVTNNASGNANNLPVGREAALSVPTPIRDQNWAGDFSQKVVWMATNDKQSAQLTLNPPQMGPIEISLKLDKGNAIVSFVSANSEVRNAIETALPRLREMFASAGIELGQTNVSAESFKQQAGSWEGNRSSSQWRADNAILDASSAGSLPARAFATQQGNGMVDIFA